MKVSIQLNETSQPVEYANVKTAYTKGPFYCLYLETNAVHKIPVHNIFRVVEEKGTVLTPELPKNDKVTSPT